MIEDIKTAMVNVGIYLQTIKEDEADYTEREELFSATVSELLGAVDLAAQLIGKQAELLEDAERALDIAQQRSDLANETINERVDRANGRG